MRGSDHLPARIARGRLLPAVLCLAVLAGCTPYQLRTILDGPRGFALRIDPASTALPALGEVTFSADGGVPPYTYSIASGGGTLDGVTGDFIAPATYGTVTVRVTDAAGRSADAQVSVQAFSAGIALLPIDTSLAVGSNVTLTVVGGTPPYSFVFDAQGTGSPALTVIDGTSRLYTSGGSAGTDTVRVTDSLSAWATATVTASMMSSAVDYTIPATSLPGTGTVGAAMPAGSFTLENSGTGDGVQPVSWKVYLSSDGILNGGDSVVASGTTAPLAAGVNTSISVPVGTFPHVPPGPWRLIAEAKAAEDTTDGNDVSGASAVTLLAPDIDYEVAASSPVSTGALTAGDDMTGTFTLQNTGAAGGAATVHWTVYASADTALGGDYLLDDGSLAGMAAGASTPVFFGGTWPSTPGTWYLIATVSADDDVDMSLNTEDGPASTTSGPPALSVDYEVQSVTHTGGTTAGDPFTGTFIYRNILADTGLQPVHWIAYISSNTTLEIGTDIVADSNTETGLPGSTASGPVAFEGNWPPLNGSWYLIVTISASDDTVPAPNRERTAAAIVTSPPAVNYTIQSVTSTGGTTAGGALAGNIVIRNAGSHDGTQAVPWNVYLSDNNTLELGADMLISSGTLPTPGLIQGGTSLKPFAGTWPAAASAKTWYLLAQVLAGDDPTTGDNVVPSAGVVVNPPDVRYSIPAVTNTGLTNAGGALAGQFSVSNTGSANGSSPINWTACVSADNTWQVTDQVVATGTVGAVGALGTSGLVPFAGTWPATAGPWYLIVRITAADDTTTGDNERATAAPFPLTVLAADYAITLVPLPAGTGAGQAVSGSFTIENAGTAAGTSPVSWSVYASLANNSWDAGDTLLASGTTAALGIGGTSSPGYAGTWPSAAGNYFVIVRAAAADDPSIADVPCSASVSVMTPPPPDYTVSFSAAMPWSGIVGTAMDLTGTCQLTIQNLSANPGNKPITWSVHISMDNVLDAGDTLVQQASVGALAGAGSTSAAFAGNWPATGGVYHLIASVAAPDDGNATNNVVPAPHVCAAGTFRYVENPADNNNGSGAPPGPQTSDTLVTLAANQTMVIEGTMDGSGGTKYDTYGFIAGTAMTGLAIRSVWMTGTDALDLWVWDAVAFQRAAQSYGPDSEPGTGNWTLIAGIPATATVYVSAQFWSSTVDAPYVITVRGLP